MSPWAAKNRRILTRRSLLRGGGGCLALGAVGPRLGWLAPSPAFAELVPSAPPAVPLCQAIGRASYPPLLDRFIAMLDPAADMFPTEVYVAEIEQPLANFSAALIRSSRSVEELRQLLPPTLTASTLATATATPLRTGKPLAIERRSFGAPTLISRDNFLRGWSHYIATFASIDVADFEIYGIRILGESPLVVATDLYYDFTGAGNEATREQRVGLAELRWERDPSSRAWTIQRWTAHTETRSLLSGPGFSDITNRCLAAGSSARAQLDPGIDHWRTALDAASGIDVYGNHGVAVGDIDGSGFDSIYVSQPSGLPNRLFRNRGDGTFEDITERSGTGILDGTASALFVDLLNRGRQDLVVVRSGGPLLFSNLGDGRFEVKPDAFHFAQPPQGTFTSAAAADYNHDGLLDLYFCVYSYYEGLNQYQFPAPYYDAQNGPPNFLFRNRGDGTFEDVTAASGMGQNNNRFSFAAEWCDYDNDGWPDLYVANDFGRKNLYHNNRDGSFADVAAAQGVEDYGPGMSTCWFDYDNDGRQDLYVANMWLRQGKRITADARFLPDTPEPIRALYRKHNAGNSLYRNTGGTSFSDESAEEGTAKAGWSWSCASWDFDHDGYSDLYVANGFVSNGNPFDLQSFFWRQVAQRSAEPPGSSPDYEMAWNAVNELVRSDYSWSGYERNVFFANNRDGTFSDISGVLGLNLIDDSRSFALSDFDHDGRMEFVLKNRTGPQLRLLHNDLESIGGSVIFRLMGRKSNRDAIGTTLTLESGGARQTKFLSAGSGFAAQHTKEVHFGVGQSSGDVTVSVRWPSGATARFENIPVNHRVDLEEDKAEFRATAFVDPRPIPPAAAPQTVSAADATVSTWLIAPLYGPDLKLPDTRGQIHQLSTLRGHAVLLTFFRLDCGNSRRQIEDLQQSVASLESVGLTVLGVAVDGSTDASAAQAFVQQSGITFPILVADQTGTAAWNIQYRYLFDRRRDLGFPTSFLIDQAGAAIRIYQGTVAAETIRRDWTTAPTTPEARFTRAMPFPGPYYGNPMSRDDFSYGIAFVEYGLIDDAQVAFERVVHDTPSHAGAWFNLGTVYLNKGDFPQAQRCLHEAVRLDPQDADAWNNLGLIAGQQEKYDEALEYFRHAALANPNHPLAVQNMMRIYQMEGRAADAQAMLAQLIVKAPTNPGLHLGLAMALIGQDKMDAGRAELETAIRLKPDFVDAINNLGALLLQSGDTAAALQQFERCVQIAPDSAHAAINLAAAYTRTGQTAQARAALQRFQVAHPGDADVREAIEKLGAQ
jgi:tetratricopeptide (TPR) repeat protein/thiol-disulfide isomerase/thioredoxin